MIEVTAGLIHSERSLPGLQRVAFLLCPLIQGQKEREREREGEIAMAMISFPIRTLILWDQGLNFMN